MSTNPFDIFNDDLAAPAAAGKPMPSVAQAKAGEGFVEQCPKCRGTGKFITYTGRIGGACFACKGVGKNTYKTSRQDRAAGRERAAAKRVEQAHAVVESANSFHATYPEIISWLRQAAKRNTERAGSFTFPADLLGKINQYGSLTDAQIAAVRKLMARDESRSAERAAAAPAVDASKIEQAFAVARERAKQRNQDGVFVKPLKLTSGDVTVHFKPGTPGSTWDGMLFAKTPDDRKLGYIKGGKFFRQFGCTEVEASAVQELAANPQDGVLAYAKAWKACGICSRTLLNNVSIERGIGPICAAKYGWAF